MHNIAHAIFHGFIFTITVFPVVPRTLRLTRISLLLAISSGNFTTTCLSQPKFGTAPKYSTVSGKPGQADFRPELRSLKWSHPGQLYVHRKQHETSALVRAEIVNVGDCERLTREINRIQQRERAENFRASAESDLSRRRRRTWSR